MIKFFPARGSLHTVRSKIGSFLTNPFMPDVWWDYLQKDSLDRNLLTTLLCNAS